MRRRLSSRRTHRGFALMALLALLVASALYFAVTALSPQVMEAYRARKTEAALAQARDALLGYSVRYRDVIDPNAVYGYLFLPDLGSSRNNNIGCTAEGCDAGNFAGNGTGFTVIGRLPWRLLGTEPLRDGNGECLWYAISGSHQREQPGAATMNWDTLGQMDVVVANGTANLVSTLASAHDRPVAVIFSAGPPLPNQNRATAGGDDVTQCGGNYDVKNYLDPNVLAALAGVTNYFDGSTNNASGDTSAVNKSLSAQGSIYKRTDDTLWPNACPSGADCTLVANDKGLVITPEALFGAIRKNANFRTDINAMLDRMVTCLRDQMAAGSAFVPNAITGYTSPADKSAGRIQSDACFNNTPPGYFNHWRDQFFVAKPIAGTFDVTVDGLAQTCNGVLIFAGQRGPGQSRVAALGEQDLPANYLEGTNLANFTAPGISFTGPGQFDNVSATQSLQQDIVRCIPTTSSMETTSPQNLVDGEGNPLGPLAAYDPGTRTLTLGSENATTNNGVDGSQLYGCAWTPEVDTRGKGFRAYFAFRFMGVTGGVGNNGFVFAAVDGMNNGTNVCGAAGTHLGYSGDNGVTPPLTLPKIGIEFDQARNAGAISSALNSGRNDPCGTSGCGGTVGYNSHSAIVYWGDRALDYDDNVHGAGTPPPDPQNPNNLSAAPPGIAFKDYRAKSDANGDGQADSYLYHVRVEVTPTRNIDSAAAELSNTTMITKVWIIRDSLTDAQIIAAMQNTTRSMMQLSPATDPTLGDSATVYDVQTSTSCSSATDCTVVGYDGCGTDNICYRQGLKSVRLGFTGSQRTQDQQVIISNFSTSWLQ